jgi:hypothetical protein
MLDPDVRPDLDHGDPELLLDLAVASREAVARERGNDRHHSALSYCNTFSARAHVTFADQVVQEIDWRWLVISPPVIMPSSVVLMRSYLASDSCLHLLGASHLEIIARPLQASGSQALCGSRCLPAKGSGQHGCTLANYCEVCLQKDEGALESYVH